MDSTVEEIKSKIDIVEFIGSLITVKKAGRNFKSNCPFHQEKTPSFVISPDRQIWHCFGSCGDGGDVIKFLMKWENITFHEALQDLARRTGVQLKEVSFEDKEWSQKERITKINYLAAEFFQYVLHKSPYGKKALDYLTGRHLNPKILEKFEIGYAPDSWDSLLQFLKKKGFRFEEIEEAGLVIKSEYGKFYDRFRGRITFPIKDIKGNTIGFSGRVLSPDEKSAKYVNTPETPIYHKRESLYGIHLTKEAIRQKNKVLIVEGEFDLIMPFQHGVENIVAIKGAAITTEQLKILKKFTTTIIFALDADEAGIEAIKRGVKEAEKLDFEMYAAQITGGKDPDEAIQADPILFKKQLESPVPIYDFLLDAITQKYPPADPFSKKKIGDEFIPYILHIQNPIILSHYTKKIAQLLDVNEDSITKTMASKKRYIRRPVYASSFKDKNTIPNRDEMLQKSLLSNILQNESPYKVAEEVFHIVTCTDFTIPVIQKIVQKFADYRDTFPDSFQVNQFFATLPSELRATADEVFLYGSSQQDMSQENIVKLAQELKKARIKQQMSQLLKDENNGSDDKNTKLSSLQEELKQVEKSLTTV